VGILGAFVPPKSELPHALIEPCDLSYGGAYASSYNLALGKPATESSAYPYSIPVAASYAVDGNTNGEFLNSSTTHTNIEQGAWWQVDLGSQKNIMKSKNFTR
jgi:hypothetical protein